MTGYRVIAVLFGVAGVLHFVIPRFFEAIVPPWLPAFLPDARALVYLSGAAEIAGALGLLWPATRPWAAWWLIALLLAVFPANVHMLLEARSRGASGAWVLALWLRLPLQPLLMWWVWRATHPVSPGG